MSALVYKACLQLTQPLLPWYLARRARRGKEMPHRLCERYGLPTQPRPPGPLLWVHGASVGELASVLPLLERLLKARPKLNILVTSGTVASAELIARKAQPRLIHQFIPLDLPAYAAAFLDAWKPDAALWLESELWPNLLTAMKARGLPSARLNARLTERSARRWSLLAPWFSSLLSTFGLSLALSAADGARLQAAGAPGVQFVGNLKFTAPTPAVDEAALSALLLARGPRPTWLFASSQPGEEALALRVHEKLVARFPNLLTLIAPRHPRRAAEIMALLPAGTPQRSVGGLPSDGAGLYLADTMGEMGTLYRAAPVVVVGGSFTPKGGHNPIEPAQCGCATLIGPDTSKCADVTAELKAAGALQQVSDEPALCAALSHLLSDEAARHAMQQAGLAATQQQEKILSATLSALENFWSPHEDA